MAEARALSNAALKAPTTITQTTPLPKAPPPGKSAVYVEAAGNPQNTQAAQAFSAGLKSFGWNTSTVSYDAANPATFDAALTSALVKHPVVVGEAGLPISLISTSVLSSYAAAKVPIIVDGAAPCTTTAAVLCTDGYADYYAAGKVIADWFVADSDGNGKAIQEATPGYPVLNGFTNGFSDEVKRLCSACSVKTVSLTLDQIEAGSGNSVVISAAKANPSYKYLIFNDGEFAGGINSALSGASLTGYKIAGHALTPESAAALRSGTQNAWTGDNGIYDGYMMADIAARFVTGASGDQMDIVKPDQLMTKANIGNIVNWQAPTNSLQLFEKLWKVGS